MHTVHVRLALLYPELIMVKLRHHGDIGECASVGVMHQYIKTYELLPRLTKFFDLLIFKTVTNYFLTMLGRCLLLKTCLITTKLAASASQELDQTNLQHFKPIMVERWLKRCLTGSKILQILLFMV